MNYSQTSRHRSPKSPAKQILSQQLTRQSWKTQAVRSLGLLALAGCLATSAQAAVLIINEATGVMTPSFRDLTNTDAGNTTYFGWTGNNDGIPGVNSFTGVNDDSGFDGSVTVGPPGNFQNDERIFNPPVLYGVGGLDGTLNQIGNADILAGSNNVFAFTATSGGQGSLDSHLTLQIPTQGTVGLNGYTTIIIQGIGTYTGSDVQLPGTPGGITLADGTTIFPQFVWTKNAEVPRAGDPPAGDPLRVDELQWWAKYQIPGNQSAYTVDLHFLGGPGINPGSMRELYVDTQFSTVGYSNDLAFVPEPSSLAALLGGCGLLGLTRRRRSNR